MATDTKPTGGPQGVDPKTETNSARNHGVTWATLTFERAQVTVCSNFPGKDERYQHTSSVSYVKVLAGGRSFLADGVVHDGMLT